MPRDRASGCLKKGLRDAVRAKNDANIVVKGNRGSRDITKLPKDRASLRFKLKRFGKVGPRTAEKFAEGSGFRGSK